MNLTDKLLAPEECKDYGTEYEPKKLSKYELAAVGGLVVMVLAVCAICFSWLNNLTTN